MPTDWSAIARGAYEEHRSIASAPGSDHPPPWDALSPREQIAWEAAVRWAVFKIQQHKERP